MSTILITGANRGIGLEFTTQYAADGWDVIACCRTPETADELQAIANQYPHVTIEPLDVQDHSAIDALGDKYRGQPIDLLLNNAGIIGPFPIAEHVDRQTFGNMDYAIWRDVIETNTFGPLKMAETFVENVAISGQKKIVNISSTTGSMAEMSVPAIAYASSKTALNRAMTTVAGELKERGIIVALFCPGYCKTRMDAHGYAMVEVTDSVAGLRPLIDALTVADAGTFTRYDGTPIAW
jgi:NAD(P)-dependent dehydrogenase (short-subunit alcohol dehydrogenase family)